jgi:hypothetical protein
MEEKEWSFNKKMAIVLCICVIGIFAYYIFTVNHGEGDPFFVFIEVPVNETFNSSVIHLDDKDIINVKGLDVKQKNGKITFIYFRYSDTTPEISMTQFNQKYGSYPTRKYLEYKGVYYYTELRIP